MSNFYIDQLNDPRWQKKRLEIMQRDNFTCQLCKSATRTLHVHHNYYSQGKLPWEYPDSCYRTLCFECHELLHNAPIITDDIGCIQPELFIITYPIESKKAFLKIGNHKGCWEVEINYGSSIFDILKGLHLLASFIDGCDCNIVEINNDRFDLFDFIKVNENLTDRKLHPKISTENDNLYF
jgi:hypothetical protein